MVDGIMQKYVQERKIILQIRRPEGGRSEVCSIYDNSLPRTYSGVPRELSFLIPSEGMPPVT
jgi:hypothetical protein